MSFGRLERAAAPRPMGEINMTPLIDVMLVLLVIFIITAPLLTTSLKVELPRTDAGTPGDTPLFIALAVDADGRLYLGDEPIAADALAQRLADAARRDPGTEVHLHADRRVAYGEVAALLALVRQAGLTRIGFVTQPPEADAPAGLGRGARATGGGARAAGEGGGARATNE